MINETASVKSFFESVQVHLSDIWLESCINWCKEENLSSNYTLKALKAKVYEQWLLLDLRDAEVPSLPPDLASKKRLVLNGNFCLQVMQVLDISKPKLWQLQKIRNNVSSRGTQQDADVAGTGKRVLQLTLTDGIQEVEAMEYRPVPSLNINIPPGIKIRIMGPVVIRRGRIMLEQQNVKVLGGEVEELTVSHAAENVLARILKLPENPKPFVIEENPIHVEREELHGPESNLRANHRQTENIPNIPKVSTAISAEEEMRIAEEIDLLMEAERDASRPQLNKSTTPDLFENDEFTAGLNNIDKIVTSTQVGNVQFNVQKVEDLSASLNIDDDVFDDIDIDAHLDQIAEQNNDCQLVTGINTVTIAKLIESKENNRKGIFKIKAKFKSVVEKLTIAEDEYKLVIKVEDATSDLTVRLHSDIISEFAGYCPAEILSLKNMLDKDGTAVEKVMKAVQKVKNKLVMLEHIMEIQMDKEVPVIVKIQ